MANQELIRSLNDQLNREATTFLRYMLQAASIKGAQWQNVRKMYLEEELHTYSRSDDESSGVA